MYPESLSKSESRCLCSLDRFASAHLDFNNSVVSRCCCRGRAGRGVVHSRYLEMNSCKTNAANMMLSAGGLVLVAESPVQEVSVAVAGSACNVLIADELTFFLFSGPVKRHPATWLDFGALRDSLLHPAKKPTFPMIHG